MTLVRGDQDERRVSTVFSGFFDSLETCLIDLNTVKHSEEEPIEQTRDSHLHLIFRLRRDLIKITTRSALDHRERLICLFVEALHLTGERAALHDLKLDLIR